MRRAFLLFIRNHIQWLVEALGRDGRRTAPLTGRRLGFLLVAYPLFLALLGIHWIGFLLDEVFFRGYRRVVIKEPLFIVGVPEAGARQLQEALARDPRQFTTFRAWEALLAPSICGRKAVKALARLDRAVGSPLCRLANAGYRRAGRALGGTAWHDLRQPVEDGLSLLAAASSFHLMPAFPASRDLWELGRFQEADARQRRVLLDFYAACLRKHAYVNGTDARLLSRNTTLASWLPDLRFAFPDARYLFCVREPVAALGARLATLQRQLERLGAQAAAGLVFREYQTVLAHVYRIMAEEQRSFFVDHLAILDLAALHAQGGARVAAALRQLSLPVTPPLQQALAALAAELDPDSASPAESARPGPAGPAEFASLAGAQFRQLTAQARSGADEQEATDTPPPA